MPDLIGLELVVALGVVILLSELVAPRVRLPPPVLQLLGGVALGFLPAFRDIHLPPETVLLIFLPMLLYWESLTTSPREIRRNLRGIVLLSTVLVIVTAGAVAAAAHLLGLAWAAAWVLGAALAPTDATAVGVLARSLPRRSVTILRAESLVNDGTALVLYAVAVSAIVEGTRPGVLEVAGRFGLSYLGGVVAGAFVGLVGWQLRKRLGEPQLQNLTILLLPFAAYLLAELVGASGVLAVVACGLMMSQVGPRVGRPLGRQQTTAFWSLTTHVLNAALFVLVGVELQAAVRGLTSVRLTRGLLAVLVIAVVLVVVRLVWLFTTIYLIRLLDRRPSQRARRTSARARVMQSFAGFRGAVSLAAALAVPQTLASGDAFPSRDLIIFITAGVIAVTLAQGVAFPAVVRWARLPEDTEVENERRLAETRATEAALAALPRLAEELGVDQVVLEDACEHYERHLRILAAGAESQGDDDEELLGQHQQFIDLLRAVVALKRRTVIDLRDEGAIDDIVLRQIQARLDNEDVRLARS